MTDTQKLQYIENVICEAFGEEWIKAPTEQRDAHRLQAAANIFAVFYYNGASVMQHLLSTEETMNRIKQNTATDQITFFELMEV